MDAAGEVAQLAQRLLGAHSRLGEQLAGALGVLGQLLLGHAQAHAERDQPGLGAVVEVALDPAQLAVLDVHGAGAGRLEGLDPLGHLGLPGEPSMTASGLRPEHDRDPSIGQIGQKYPCPVIAQTRSKNSEQDAAIPAVPARARLPAKAPTSSGRSASTTNQPWMPSAAASGSTTQIGQK